MLPSSSPPPVFPLFALAFPFFPPLLRVPALFFHLLSVFLHLLALLFLYPPFFPALSLSLKSSHLTSLLVYLLFCLSVAVAISRCFSIDISPCLPMFFLDVAVSLPNIFIICELSLSIYSWISCLILLSQLCLSFCFLCFSFIVCLFASLSPFVCSGHAAFGSIINMFFLPLQFDVMQRVSFMHLHKHTPPCTHLEKT